MTIRPTKLLQVFMVLAVVKLSFMLALTGMNTAQPEKQPQAVSIMDIRPAMAQEEGEQEQEAQPAAQEQAEQDMNINEELKDIRARRQELDRRERNLKMLEAEIDEKLERLNRLEKGLEAMLEEAEVLKDEKIKHLVDVYSNMKPQQAAQVLETLDEDIAVKILAGMRGRQAGEILTDVDSTKAARLSELLTELQTPFIE